MTLAHASVIVARLAWRRFWRGWTVWVFLVLALLPAVMAAVFRVDKTAEGAWRMTLSFGLRFPMLLGAALLLSPALGEELDAKTWTYLWSRPVPRGAVLLGKLAALLPLGVAAFFASFAAAWVITGTGDPRALAQALGATFAGLTAAAALAAGLGALVPRHALVVVLAYMLVLEQVLPHVPALCNLSVAHHATGLSGAGAGSPFEAVLWLLVLAAVWLGLGLWRIRRAELATEAA